MAVCLYNAEFKFQFDRRACFHGGEASEIFSVSNVYVSNADTISIIVV